MRKRKLSKDRQAKLDRIHKRDCPGWRNIEFSCSECARIWRETDRPKAKG